MIGIAKVTRPGAENCQERGASILWAEKTGEEIKLRGLSGWSFLESSALQQYVGGVSAVLWTGDTCDGVSWAEVSFYHEDELFAMSSC